MLKNHLNQLNRFFAMTGGRLRPDSAMKTLLRPLSVKRRAVAFHGG
jgi:hypothetical protein